MLPIPDIRHTAPCWLQWSGTRLLSLNIRKLAAFRHLFQAESTDSAMAQQKKLEACKDLIAELSESVEGNQNTYTKFAEEYDDILIGTGYILPRRISQVCLSELPQCDEKSAILDVATGTGLVGHELRAAGFKGIIDGIDGSKEMVEACKYKDDYRKMKVELLSKDKALLYEDCSYDAVICSGAMSKGHVPHECLREMIRVLKPGGVLVFNASKLPNDPETKILKSVARIMGGEMDAGRCTFIKQEPEVVDNKDPFYKMSQSSTIFCYKKT